MSKKRKKIRKQKLADQKETRIKKLIKKSKKENKLKKQTHNLGIWNK